MDGNHIARYSVHSDVQKEAVTNKKHSIAEARRNLPQLIRDAESGEAVELTRHGKSVAMIVSRDTYERLSSQKPDFWEAYKAFRRRHDLKALDIDPDEVWANTRSKDPGPDRRW